MSRHQRYYRAVRATRSGLLQLVANNEGLTPEQVQELVRVADPQKAGHDFVLRLWRDRAIRLPEDGSRVRRALENFKKYQRKLDVRDINQYKSLHLLEEAIEPFLGTASKRQGGLDFDPLSLRGVEVVKREDGYTVVHVTDPGSLSLIGMGTKWCTRYDYDYDDEEDEDDEFIEECMAESYLDDFPYIGVILKGNVPVAQYTPDYDQIMDRNDEPLRDPALLKLIPPPDTANRDVDEYGLTEVTYAAKVLGGRWPEAESSIMGDPQSAYVYARDVIKGRWPEAEDEIATDPIAAAWYARDVIGGRWPEAEDVIATDPQTVYTYATGVLHSRFPKGEATITRSGLVVLYVKALIGDRWREAEPLIMQTPGAAYQYARDIIEGRWPEAEPTILENEYYTSRYAFDVIKGRWPEAEEKWPHFRHEWRTYGRYQ